MIATTTPGLEIDLIACERVGDAPRVEALIERAFGPGRFAKTAERLREGRQPLLELSFVAWRAGEAVGTVRLWPVRVGEAPGLLLGPIAVDAGLRRQGLGARLVSRAMAAARTAGWGFIILVGDQPFFGPLGFSAAPAAKVHLPGPVNQGRVMAHFPLPGGSTELQGPVTSMLEWRGARP